jgi:MYXO-CTERM domain-containing protein
MKRLAFIAASALLSAPALPCTVPLSNAREVHPDVTDARLLPTNLQLFVAPPLLGVQGVLARDDGATVELATEATPLGGVELSPDTRYTWLDSTLARRAEPVVLTIGDGRDDDAPSAPEIDIDARRVPENQDWLERQLSADCGYVAAHAQYTLNSDDSDAVIAAFHTDGTFLAVGRGTVAALDFDGSLGGAVEVVAVDAAGNTSDVVVVELEPVGGCAQTSTSTSMALALAIVGLVRVRRRR